VKKPKLLQPKQKNQHGKVAHDEKVKFKDKEFKTLSTKEKDELLEKIAKQLGFL
jgi:hypothetical protein